MGLFSKAGLFVGMSWLGSPFADTVMSERDVFWGQRNL